MKGLNTMIVEDQSAIRRNIRSILEKSPNVGSINESAGVVETLAILKQYQPDLMLLDIRLKDGTAFDLLNIIGPFSFKIIFLSSHQEYALKAIKFGPLDYLLKPVNTNELLDLLQRVATNFTGKEKNIIVLSDADCLHVVKIDDIMYCHSDNGYTTFYLSNGQAILTSQHLKAYEDSLPKNVFIRPHKSYLINYHYLQKYRKDGFLILRDGMEIPLASRKKESILEYINNL
ncbi:LytR/AlgR family response regulator transcription factor [Niastella sp. OAS944]|uniref:LytR/AlgR family response regulator transcription factor n=1 Tax=Niastella sp. OAS944 TaxID=2664089 RepID=UPI0034979462|nr:two-component system LytT family response regulator [Chitinophagaceae bacterium OAS944]